MFHKFHKRHIFPYRGTKYALFAAHVLCSIYIYAIYTNSWELWNIWNIWNITEKQGEIPFHNRSTTFLVEGQKHSFTT